MSDDELVTQARLFQSADPEVRRCLARMKVRPRVLAAGESIFQLGDPADCIFVVAAAREAGQGGAEPLVQVRLARAESERAVRLVRVVRGDIFGEVELLGAGLDPRPGKRATTAQALTALRVASVPWTVLAELFEHRSGHSHALPAACRTPADRRGVGAAQPRTRGSRHRPRRLAGGARGGFRHRGLQPRELSAQAQPGGDRRGACRQPRDDQPAAEGMGEGGARRVIGRRA